MEYAFLNSFFYNLVQLGIAQNVRGYSYVTNTDVKKGVLDSFISLNFSYYFPIKPGVKPDEVVDEGWDK